MSRSWLSLIRVHCVSFLNTLVIYHYLKKTMSFFRRFSTIFSQSEINEHDSISRNERMERGEDVLEPDSLFKRSVIRRRRIDDSDSESELPSMTTDSLERISKSELQQLSLDDDGKVVHEVQVHRSNIFVVDETEAIPIPSDEYLNTSQTSVQKSEFAQYVQINIEENSQKAYNEPDGMQITDLTKERRKFFNKGNKAKRPSLIFEDTPDEIQIPGSSSEPGKELLSSNLEKSKRSLNIKEDMAASGALTEKMSFESQELLSSNNSSLIQLTESKQLSSASLIHEEFIDIKSKETSTEPTSEVKGSMEEPDTKSKDESVESVLSEVNSRMKRASTFTNIIEKPVIVKKIRFVIPSKSDTSQTMGAKVSNIKKIRKTSSSRLVKKGFKSRRTELSPEKPVTKDEDLDDDSALKRTSTSLLSLGKMGSTKQIPLHGSVESLRNKASSVFHDIVLEKPIRVSKDKIRNKGKIGKKVINIDGGKEKRDKKKGGRWLRRRRQEFEPTQNLFPGLTSQNASEADLGEVRSQISHAESSTADYKSMESINQMISMSSAATGSTLGNSSMSMAASVTSDGILVASRTSLLPEFLQQKRACRGCKYVTRELPVNYKGADAMFRDYKREDLVKIIQVKMLPRNLELYTYEERRKEKKTWFKKLNIAIVALFQYGFTDQLLQLSLFEFYTLLIFHEINLEQFMRDMYIFLHLGPFVGLFYKGFIMCLFDAPLMMYILTLAGFTRCKYIRLYESMPMLRGLSYCVFLLFFLKESRTCTYIEMGVRCVARLFITENIYDCKIDGDDMGEKCVSLPTNTRHNTICSADHRRWSGYENFATQHFMRFMMGGLSKDRTTSDLEFDLVYIGIAFIWLLIFICAWTGFARLKKMLIILIAAVLAIIAMTWGHTLIYRYMYNIYVYYHLRNLLDSKAIHHLIATGLTAYTNLPFLVWIGSMKPEKEDPQRAAVLLLTVKALWTFLIASSSQMCMFNVIDRYKLNPDCFIINEAIFIHAMMPDFFGDGAFASLFMITWIMKLVILQILRAIAILQMSVETICEVTPLFSRHPAPLAAALCAFLILFVRCQYQESINDTFTRYLEGELDSCLSVCYIILMLGITFLYTWQRFQNDFIFFYGSYPRVTWKFLLDINIIITFFLSGLIIYIEGIKGWLSNAYSLVPVVVVLLAVVIVLFHHTCPFMYHRRSYKALFPSPRWRAYDRDVHAMLHVFVAVDNIRSRQVRQTYQCKKHDCLLQDHRFTKLVAQQQHAKTILIREDKKRADAKAAGQTKKH